VYDAAIARYPEASAIPVSVQVEFHTPGRTTTQAHTFTGDVVAMERGEAYVTLGYFEIDESSGSPVNGAAIDEPVTTSQADTATDEPPHDEAASERSGTAPNTTPDNPTGGTAAEQTDDNGGLDGRTLALIVATAGIAGAAIITIRWFNFKHKPVEFGSGGRRG
jgi:hypothetical protein